MDTFMAKFEDVFLPLANKLNTNRVIQSVSRGLMSMLAVLMVGALGAIFLNLPIDAYQQFITSTNLKGVFQTLVNATTNMFALYAAFGIAFAYARETKHDAFIAGFISLVSFLVITPMVTQGEGWEAVTNLPLSWLGATGLFTAMFVAIVSTKIYVKISDMGLVIKMPDGVPEFVSRSFVGIIPGLIIVILFAVLSYVVSLTPFGNVHQLIYGVIGMPLQSLGNNVFTALLIYFLSGLCWFFGIHGIAVVGAIIPIWFGADFANMGAMAAGVANSELPNIITYSWINVVSSPGGAGATIGLVIWLTFFSKTKRYKAFGKVAFVPSLFNINEPVTFGLPCVLNPVLMIPYIFLPVINIMIAYALTVSGILPRSFGIGAPMGTPLVVQAIFTGGWKLALFQAFAIVLSLAVYYPFFRILEKKQLEEESVA